MAWLKKLEVFRERFTPQRRRIVAGLLLTAWVAGMVVRPGQYLLWISITGIIIFFSA